MRARFTLLAAVGLVTLLASAIAGAPAIAKTKTKTFQNPAAITIPGAVDTPTTFSPGQASSNIDVSKKGTIKDVNVGVQATHPDTSDLALWLFKDETYIPLIFGNSGPDGNTEDYGGGTGCTGGITVFDTQANISINQASNPFAGTFLTADDEFTLAEFNGEQLKGTWSLLAYNFEAPPPPGTRAIDCFQLTAKYKKPKKK